MRQIYLVDDDQSIHRSVGRLLRAERFEVTSFESPVAFLEKVVQPSAAKPEACVIADLRMPEMSGMQMHDAMLEARCRLPVIFLTGHGQIPESVAAIKRGAVNFLTKPVARDALLSAIAEAFAALESGNREQAAHQDYQARFDSLTPREQEVCRKVVQGLLNKQIAAELGASEKTIKIHRGRVMEKMRAGSVAELVRMIDRIEQA